MSKILGSRVDTCCLCFCVWGHRSQYRTPVFLPKSATEIILFSSCRCSPRLPCFAVDMYFTLFSCRDLDGCPFFEKRYRAPRLSLCKLLQNAFTWTPVSKGWSLFWPMWLKGKWWGGSFSEVFQACALFCNLSSSQACHACKCCPVIGHFVLTNFISTNWAKVIGVILKVLKEKKKKNSTSDVWTFHYRNSLPPCLSLTVCHSWLPSAMVLPNPLHLCPLLQFNYQQDLSEEPENESVIISFLGV